VTDTLECNKKIVLDFYNTVVNDKNYDAAIKYLGSNFKEHSFNSIDGLAGLEQGIKFLIKHPNSDIIIKRILAEHDLVMLHVHTILEPDTLGYAMMELFRVEDGKVVEHWDISESIPDHLYHKNGVF